MANEQPGAGSGEPEGDSFERRLREALEHTAREMRDKHASLDCTFEVITHAAVDLIPGGEHAGITLATRAAVAVIAAQREEQFRSALASRDIIGQAKGILMDRFSVDADRAFGLLRQLSQDRNAPLVEIARKLAETEHPPQGEHRSSCAARVPVPSVPPRAVRRRSPRRTRRHVVSRRAGSPASMLHHTPHEPTYRVVREEWSRCA
ncbi:hypothetical protein A4U64_27395 (plasmid) [Rhodococcus sp. WB1]|nr:hypothetical protein A4U64_27395 [Rhodococcus sp. WB1]